VDVARSGVNAVRRRTPVPGRWHDCRDRQLPRPVHDRVGQRRVAGRIGDRDRSARRQRPWSGVADRVRHIRKFSDHAIADVDAPIDVLYIDGAHRYGPARADIRDWGARATDGGTMLIHDSFSSIGVTLAILRELLLGSRFRYVGRSRSMTIYRADLSAGPGARAGNAVRQLAQLPWFVKNVALKVGLTLGLGKVLGRMGRNVPDWPY
jgi:hypothetical protein